MRTTQIVFCLALTLTANAAQGRDISQSQVSALTPASVGASIAAMPLPFTKNEGQWPDSILFRTSAGGATMWFTKNGVYYQFFRKIEKADAAASPLGSSMDAIDALPGKFGHERDSIETMMVKAEFVGASESVEVVALQELEYKCNYFLGSEPSKWRSDVPNYSVVTLRGIYPGVDVRYSSDANHRAVYEFIVAPGAELSQLKVAYEGAETTLNSEGKFVVNSIWGEMMEAMTLPTTTTSKATLLVNRSRENPTSAGLSVAGDASSPNSTLGLAYSTYLGGYDFDLPRGISVDASGNAFVMGTSYSPDFPTLNPYQTNQPGYDVFVTKLSSTGNSLIYSTYLGGDVDDYGRGIAVDVSGNAFVTGYTESTNFPTLNPYQADPGDGFSDVFVTKLSSSGNSLIYSTYLGGGSYDYGRGIAVDASGNVFVTGTTESSDFPTLNPYQNDPGDGLRDVFVTKLNASGNSLIYSTYLGGGSYDYVHDIAVDASGNVFVTGETFSTDFPTLNPYQTDPGDGNYDGYVTKLSSTGNSLIYSTYLGGGSWDYCSCIAVDASGNAFVTGSVASTDFPTLNPYQTDQVGNDAFVTKLSSAGNSLIYSTYLGGGDYDYANDIAVDAGGNAFVIGATRSTNFPTHNPYQTDLGDGNGLDVFVTKLSSTGNSLIYSTYLGGNDEDVGRGIAVDASGNVFVTGETISTNFPTLNPYQTSPGQYDVFVTKLSYDPSCCNLAGDADGDASVTIGDAVYLIGYIFLGGGAPPCLSEGDADADASITIGDAVYLIGYIFLGGAPPVCGP